MEGRLLRGISDLHLTCAFIVRGDVDDLKRFLAGLDPILERHNLRLLFQTFSADRLLIVRESEYRKEGGR